MVRRPGRRPCPARRALRVVAAESLPSPAIVDVGARRRSAWRVLGARLSRETSVCLEKLGVRGSVRPQPATRQPRASRRRGRAPGGAAEQASASYNRRTAGLEQDKVYLLVVIGVRSDGRKKLIALADGVR